MDMFYIPTRYPNGLAGESTPAEFYEMEDAETLHKLCRIDIGKREEILKEVERFSEELKERFDYEVYLYGSFVRGDVHEGSDIDLIIVGDLKERFFDSIGKIFELIDPPIEPLVYTRDEFDAMKRDNLFMKSVLKHARRLA